jgi:GT2 family glycosyltransferase
MNDLVPKVEKYDATIVIPTFNRLDKLKLCLDALSMQECPDYRIEVIVVDDGGSDGTLEWVEQRALDFPVRLRGIANQGKGPAAARNTGMRESSSELILNTDDDCKPAPGWVQAMIHFFQTHPDYSGAGGEIIRMRDTLISFYIDSTGCMKQVGEPDDLLFLVTANTGFRKAALESIKGFNERIPIAGGEDYELAYRLRMEGYKMALVPDAVVHHAHHDTLKGLVNMCVRHGKGMYFQKQMGVESVYPNSHDLKQLIVDIRDGVKSQFKQRGGSLKKRVAYSFFHVLRQLGIYHGYNGSECKVSRTD